jgi:hypothetical protein
MENKPIAPKEPTKNEDPVSYASGPKYSWFYKKLSRELLQQGRLQ